MQKKLFIIFLILCVYVQPNHGMAQSFWEKLTVKAKKTVSPQTTQETPTKSETTEASKSPASTNTNKPAESKTISTEEAAKATTKVDSQLKAKKRWKTTQQGECFYEGFGAQPGMRELERAILFLQSHQRGEWKLKALPINRYLLVGLYDDDKQEMIRELAKRHDVIVQYYDMDDVFAIHDRGLELKRIYGDANKLARDQKKLVVIYFTNVSKKFDYSYILELYIDRNEENPYLMTIVQEKQYQDLLPSPRSRLHGIEINAMSKEDQIANINYYARMYGVILSPSFVDFLSSAARGKSAMFVKRAFERSCRKLDDGSYVCNKSRLVHEFVRHYYFKVGAIGATSAAVIACLFYGISHPHPKIVKLLNEYAWRSRAHAK